MLPYLTNKIQKRTDTISVFHGLNSSPYKKENELVSCLNTSASDYPCLSVSNVRKTEIKCESTINGASSYNGLFYTATDDTSGKSHIYHGENKTELPESEVTSKRFFAGMSDNILIMPDKVMYNVSSDTAKKLTSKETFDIEGAIQRGHEKMPGISSSIPDGVAILTSSKIDSTLLTYGVYSCNSIWPNELKEGEFVYISMDVEAEKAYEDDAYEKFKSDMKKGMFIKISSVTETSQFFLSGETYGISAIGFEQTPIDTKDYEDIFITSLTIERKIPDLEHMVSYGNRVWGVEKNTVRCSLLGDSSVWYDFSADTFGTLPSSCYSVDVDTDGDFTAICHYNGNIIAFKENCIHKICGNQPENFTLYTQTMKGVMKGKANTLVEIGGILYYESTDGFYAYSGGYPVCISDKIRNCDAISAGTDGKNYYVIVNDNGKRKIMVYYPDFKIWHTESAKDEFLFVKNEKALFAVSPNEICNISNANGKENTQWNFEFEFDENTHCDKIYTRLLLKYSLKKGGYYTIKTVCDDNSVLGSTHGIFEANDKGECIIQLPRIRCKNISVKFEGYGDFILKSVTREYFLLKEGGK